MGDVTQFFLQVCITFLLRSSATVHFSNATLTSPRSSSGDNNNATVAGHLDSSYVTTTRGPCTYTRRDDSFDAVVPDHHRHSSYVTSARGPHNGTIREDSFDATVAGRNPANSVLNEVQSRLSLLSTPPSDARESLASLVSRWSVDTDDCCCICISPCLEKTDEKRTFDATVYKCIHGPRTCADCTRQHIESSGTSKTRCPLCRKTMMVPPELRSAEARSDSQRIFQLSTDLPKVVVSYESAEVANDPSVELRSKIHAAVLATFIKDVDIRYIMLYFTQNPELPSNLESENEDHGIEMALWESVLDRDDDDDEQELQAFYGTFDSETFQISLTSDELRYNVYKLSNAGFANMVIEFSQQLQESNTV